MAAVQHTAGGDVPGEENGVRRRDFINIAAVSFVGVGGVVSLLPLINRLIEGGPDRTILVTTGTVTSAAMLGKRLPPGALHQFVPVDLPQAVERFLNHWKPDLALWVESELWPNLIQATNRRGIPMALVNARLSERSCLAG